MLFCGRNSLTQLAGFLISAAFVLLAPPLPGQVPSESESRQVSGQQLPDDVFQEPRPKQIAKPSYPEHENLQRIEGWVSLGFMVDPQGKPFEVTVLRSTGNKTFENLAVKAIEQSTFEPGSLNGQPIESSYELKFQFTNENITAPGATPGFIHRYESLQRAIKANNQATAEASLKELKIANLYEDAYFGIATYSYASKWGDDSQQLEGLRRAIAGEDRARYLPKELFSEVLRACLDLELKMHFYAEALTTWKRLQKSGIDPATAAQYKPVIAQLQTLRSDNSGYDVYGVLEDGSWKVHLFKRRFRTLISTGYISQAKLRCEKRFALFPIEPKVDYQVPRDYGSCLIEFEGAPGTRFVLAQF